MSVDGFFSRCRFIFAASGLFLSTLVVTAQFAVAREGGGRHPESFRHAISLIGEPDVPADFKQFDWVNPDAPRGGDVRLRAIGTFDTLNRFSPKGIPAAGVSLVDATLMIASLDEAAADYGLIAETVSFPDDFSSATFRLRENARFSDGARVTPEDVVYSLDALKTASPRYATYYKDIVKVEAIGTRDVKFVFARPGNRELPSVAGSLPVLAKHYWIGTDERGQPRELARGTLEVPVGAGPYRVAGFDTGRSISYERIADWWANDLAVARGQWNFARIGFTYYRDRLPAFEGFKVGEIDFWPENSAKGWATEFGFDAVKRGFVKREELPDNDIKPMQGFIFNLRRPQFQDRRVREAIGLAFNFEWANKAMFFDQYRRSSSYFGNTELASRGLPEGAELEILNTQRGLLSPDVFTSVFRNPENTKAEDFRKHMARGTRLLSEAGYELSGAVRKSASGVRLTAEVLLAQPSFERLVLAYKAELAKLGVEIDVRVVDAANYRRRLDTFDFDMIVGSFPQSQSPGNEQREYWGSQAADQHRSRNLVGLKDPGVDALIERLIYANGRSDLVAATRALDRVLLAGHYLVPHFHSPVDRLAYWAKFNRPAKLPRHAVPQDAFLRVWWYDEAAARRLAEARKN